MTWPQTRLTSNTCVATLVLTGHMRPSKTYVSESERNIRKPNLLMFLSTIRELNHLHSLTLTKSMAEFHLPSEIENEAEQTSSAHQDFEENATYIDDEYLDYIHYLASRSNHDMETFGSYDEVFGRVLGNSTSTRWPETAEELPVVNLTAEELTERGLVVCAICREKLVPSERLSELPCLHYYHKDCISSWLTNRNTCPLCRHNVRN
ncbi:unnamed protein product [Eruca vesicaria subsp. sativa]|uniref:RING-type domain-containing protein n=1 Tax=Eruca vesicaria subsp. sativa TaxID=29727 RepID=A0ABC8LMI9_ERUVS|nr:unnamed protein product [Eruca vesicaria subsp. sativa]